MSRLERRNYGRGHGYKLDGRKIPGVTTVLDTLDKPALREWYARTAAERVVDHWDELLTMPPSARLEFVRYGPREKVREAALRGTEIHTHGEALARGEAVEVPPEHRGPVEAYARFLDEWDIQPWASETPVAFTRQGSEYGGTADLWACIGVRDNATALVDIKTGRGVYSEVGMQLAAYAGADLMRVGDEESALEWPDLIYVAHVQPDSVRMLPVHATQATHRAFLYLLQVYREVTSWKEEPLIGEAERP